MKLWSKSKKISIFISTVNITVEIRVKKKKSAFSSSFNTVEKKGSKKDKKILSTVVYHC